MPCIGVKFLQLIEIYQVLENEDPPWIISLSSIASNHSERHHTNARASSSNIVMWRIDVVAVFFAWGILVFLYKTFIYLSDIMALTQSEDTATNSQNANASGLAT